MIDPGEALRFQGYRAGEDVPSAQVQALCDEACALAREIVVPRAVVRWRAVVRGTGDRLDLGDTALEIPDSGARWGPVEHVGIAVVTIGDALERRVAALWEERELPLAMMLDGVGSAAVEGLAALVGGELCREGGTRGLVVTDRMAPGYGRWEVTEQQRLFAVCPGTPIGVELNAACLMTPLKSVSLVVGAGRGAHAAEAPTPCARCGMASCAYRRLPVSRPRVR